MSVMHAFSGDEDEHSEKAQRKKEGPRRLNTTISSSNHIYHNPGSIVLTGEGFSTMERTAITRGCRTAVGEGHEGAAAFHTSASPSSDSHTPLTVPN